MVELTKEEVEKIQAKQSGTPIVEQPIQTNAETDGNWAEKELTEINENRTEFERLESFKPEENKTEDLIVDISEPWQKWEEKEGEVIKTIKKIIPVTHQGVRKNFWLNVKNPFYTELLSLTVAATKEGNKSFACKMLRTGQQKDTKYLLVK